MGHVCRQTVSDGLRNPSELANFTTEEATRPSKRVINMHSGCTLSRGKLPSSTVIHSIGDNQTAATVKEQSKQALLFTTINPTLRPHPQQILLFESRPEERRLLELMCHYFLPSVFDDRYQRHPYICSTIRPPAPHRDLPTPARSPGWNSTAVADAQPALSVLYSARYRSARSSSGGTSIDSVSRELSVLITRTCSRGGEERGVMGCHWRPSHVRSRRHRRAGRDGQR